MKGGRFWPELITSRRHPQVARFRALQGARGRREHGLLLVEGTHLLEEVLSRGLRPERVLATEAWIARHPPLVQLLPLAVPLQPVAEPVLAAVATTEHPDGVVLSLPLPDHHPAPGADLLLALDRLQDPGNLGTLMRTALAADVGALWLAGGADPWQPKVLRASAGAALALPLRRLEGTAELIERLAAAQGEGLQVVATVVRGGLPYWQLDWRRPTVLLLGNEGAGLAPELLEHCSHRVTIPHSPQVESLNVAVAAAPLLLERSRQRFGSAGGG
ncbi:RNA methyltransferase [Cyanobium sp. Morenito 9A2]|uniref:TrmH family RNA methyltransferase n=1 Tax=Cyanobium sp. Morenito 9A2 TaxID=2823718 RepID=UPI0020CC7BDF|nr:RNA methyltransferase [Cyanobium sp. Morenito 9A2]MCP9848236.1 RNA methyltransferase [Cyanobium sp. Morenito 9A2]